MVGKLIWALFLKSLLGVSLLLGSNILCSQDAQMFWYEPASSSPSETKSTDSADCVRKPNTDDVDGSVHIVELEERPLFVHTHPEYKKWNKDKFLMECSANFYQANETTFLLLHFKINSENAKHAYGNLNKGAQVKLTFDNKEHIYLENIERDRGSAQRSKKYTTYKGIFPVDKGKMKDFQKNKLDKMGIVWEEGYQEYDVQNKDMLLHQAHCIKEY